MIEISENIPFLWRLSSDDDEGFCAVSMVVPFNSGSETLEHTIETDVLSFSSDTMATEDEETLEWNEDDISLFLKLISNRACAQDPGTLETIRVDLTDPETIEIVNVVAAAGFGLPQSAEDYLLNNVDHPQGFDFDIGSPVSLSTKKGFKRCIVVDMDEDEIVCVMQENLESDLPKLLKDIVPQDLPLEEFAPHELLLVKRHHLVHPLYTSLAPSHQDVLH